ncbi:MAG: ABC transporter permease [Gammaproteobacteria bacterium]|nr:ABC transporter permease [Gammaproteobacteria bacterium]
MNQTIAITPVDLSLTAVLVVILAGCSWLLRLGIGWQLLIAATRMVVQLLLVGLVLTWVFGIATLWLVMAWGIAMVAIAGYEIYARQSQRLGRRGYAIGSGAMALSSGVVAILMLVVVVQPDPPWSPQYAIPLLGMLLGNTMNGVAIGMERLTTSMRKQKPVIEARLLLGHSFDQAVMQLRREAMNAGLIPTINGMAIAGLVSLPGMMTGQILAGADPMTAVLYQILIWLGIAGGTGFGALAAVVWTTASLSDDRDRLRLDRLHAKAAE